ncbi:glycosyl hydrolase family 26 [Kitasatospora sp. SolWspMP-SS2h]|uniref:glycoside hydrolase family 26 protein n=1 Tax=Kitasatospora sp. SolWspMP-SS2h TaxID=1305729 RepID=UPI000DBAD1E9|nr:glycosyl hydrolase [Kitasatospora sp. SolWspMP-SS2h]RAJ38884.1 glycosyl hydrolase family 26 [Kitasatospora sp. SolWspMP-SS2h]
MRVKRFRIPRPQPLRQWPERLRALPAARLWPQRLRALPAARLWRSCPPLALAGLAIVLVLGCTALLLDDGAPNQAAAQTGPPTAPAPTVPGGTVPAEPPEEPGTVARREQLMSPPGVLFGIATPSAPSAEEAADMAQAAGVRSTVQEYFLKWNQDFDRKAFDASYRLGGVPLLTWEPWSGGDKAVDQPEFALARIAAGAHDDYVRRFAQDVKKAGRPVVLRFAHEMNEPWYTWSEERNGNRRGDYVAAWRHIHDVFEQQGVTNAVWFWCPDLQSPGKSPLSRYYPGDDYVDWIGTEAYSTEGETTAEQLLGATYRELTALSDKPLFIGEAGVRPSDVKAALIRDLFSWLSAHPRVIGFVWFQFSDADGSRYDWRFTTSPAAQRAFREGLSSLLLVPAPMR